VLFVPQGEFVMLGAMTLATLQTGQVPGTAWLLLVLGCAVALMEIYAAARSRRWKRVPAAVALAVLLPIALLLVCRWLAPLKPGLPVQLALSLALVVPLGPMLYRLAFQPIASASVLVLLIVAVAVHYALVGLGLLFFGGEGWRTPPFTDARIEAGPMIVSGQSLWAIGAATVLMLLLWTFFARTLWGKALRATAINRIGARLVGIRTEVTGTIAFTIAALLGAFSGVLIAPFTTIYYDSGFLIGLKGFVATVIGGLVSYPLAAAGALLVGVLESFASFWASALKDAIVFTLLIPFLLWRSLLARHVEEDEDS
jgi:branched-chain amino acid transport system permease protein